MTASDEYRPRSDDQIDADLAQWLEHVGYARNPGWWGEDPPDGWAGEYAQQRRY